MLSPAPRKSTILAPEVGSVQKHPVGVKTAPAFWAFLKKMLFSPNYWLSLQKSLNFAGQNQVVLTSWPVNCNIFCWKLARFFSLSAAHAFVQHATSFLQNIFFGVHPTPLPNPDASHQLRIDMAVHPGRKATGNRWFRQFPHWIHSTCVNHRFIFNSFFDAEDSLGVVTCFMSPTKFGTQRSVAGRSISDQKCWIGWWLLYICQCFTG